MPPGPRTLSVPAPRRAAWLATAAFGIVVLVAAGWWWRSVAPVGERANVPTVLEPAPAPPSPMVTAQAEGASYRELLEGRSDDWRVARLALNPRILVIEFPNLASQGAALNRLAALLEKHKAPRDRVLTDEGLARFIQQVGDTPETFYFGHDYPAEAVARFFTLSVNQQVRLNPSELRLGNLLLFSKMLREENDRLVPAPEREAVVTFSALQADNPRTAVDETVDAQRREAILRHELSHGEFFTNAAYRQHCWTFWQNLSDEDRMLFRSFLTAANYDPHNDELMVNETQAFLMHTPDQRAFSARIFGVPEKKLEALRARFREGMPPSIFSEIGR